MDWFKRWLYLAVVRFFFERLTISCSLWEQNDNEMHVTSMNPCFSNFNCQELILTQIIFQYSHQNNSLFFYWWLCISDRHLIKKPARSLLNCLFCASVETRTSEMEACVEGDYTLIKKCLYTQGYKNRWHYSMTFKMWKQNMIKKYVYKTILIKKHRCIKLKCAQLKQA